MPPFVETGCGFPTRGKPSVSVEWRRGRCRRSVAGGWFGTDGQPAPHLFAGLPVQRASSAVLYQSKNPNSAVKPCLHLRVSRGSQTKIKIRKQMWKKQGVFPIFFAQEGVAAAVRSNCGAQGMRCPAGGFVSVLNEVL